MPDERPRVPATEVRDFAAEAFRSLREQALRSNLRRVESLEEALDAAASRRLDPAGRTVASGTAHTVAGSAGTFGFVTATAPARQLEVLFRDAELTRDELETARGWIRQIRTALADDQAADLD